MYRLIGKPKPEAPAPSLADASKTLTDRTDTLDGRIKALDKELAEFKKKLAAASTPAAKNAIKARATQVLKRKKMLEKQRDSVAQQAFNIDQQAFAIESLKNTAQTVAAMKVGAKELKKEYKSIDVGKIEDLQDDLADLMLDADEVNDIMGRSYAMDEVGEDELEAEFEALADEFDVAEEEEVPDYLKASEMPAPPTSTPATATATDPVEATRQAVKS